MVDVSATPGRTHVEIAEALLAAGVRVLQLRDKVASPRCLNELIEALVPRCRAAGAVLILNDNLDLAVLHRVGVHLGQRDASPTTARQRLGPGQLIGLSTHDLDQALAADRVWGVDYIGFGPIFETATKHLAVDDRREPDPAVGLGALREVVEASGLPVVAIGGINEETLRSVVDTGVDAVAVISAVTGRCDMRAAAETFMRAFGTGVEG